MKHRTFPSRFVTILTGLLALTGGSASATEVGVAFPFLPAFSQPLDLQDPRDGTDRLFVVERAGRVFVFDNDPAAASRSLFLDIADSVTTQTEGGLLGLAFHPDYETNRFLYVTYTSESPRRTILARFTASASDPDLCDPGSEHRVLVLPQVNLHHKGGCITFGPDGYLYISLGEDGQSELSQDRGQLEGKLLRIDVDNPAGGLPYGIPPDNPFVGNPFCYREEIFAYGFRNPWRFSIDNATGAIWLGDVGQGTWEEIDIVRKGRNYGWPRMEGTMCFSPPVCDTAGLNIDLPVYQYPHSGGASITGGFVYRGPTQPSLFGRYVYADYVAGIVWALTYNGNDPPVNETLHDESWPGLIPSFGVDAADELYFVSFDGRIYRFFGTATAVKTPPPVVGALDAVHPNPFRSAATIAYTLAESGRVALEVFDVRGGRVAVLSDGPASAGSRTAVWDGRDRGGRPLPSGLYFCRLAVDGAPVDARRLLLLR